MQKLVTVYLDNTGYKADKTFVTQYGDKHGLVEEHLKEYLQAGWTIRDICGFGGGSDALAVRGWAIVVLETGAS